MAQLCPDEWHCGVVNQRPLYRLVCFYHKTPLSMLQSVICSKIKRL